MISSQPAFASFHFSLPALRRLISPLKPLSFMLLRFRQIVFLQPMPGHKDVSDLTLTR